MARLLALPGQETTLTICGAAPGRVNRGALVASTPALRYSACTTPSNHQLFVLTANSVLAPRGSGPVREASTAAIGGGWPPSGTTSWAP